MSQRADPLKALWACVRGPMPLSRTLDGNDDLQLSVCDEDRLLGEIQYLERRVNLQHDSKRVAMLFFIYYIYILYLI